MTSEAVKVTPEFVEYADVELMREASRMLDYAFTWRDSPQGHDYWHEVHENLLRLRHAVQNYREQL